MANKNYVFFSKFTDLTMLCDPYNTDISSMYGFTLIFKSV